MSTPTFNHITELLTYLNTYTATPAGEIDPAAPVVEVDYHFQVILAVIHYFNTHPNPTQWRVTPEAPEEDVS